MSLLLCLVMAKKLLVKDDLACDHLLHKKLLMILTVQQLVYAAYVCKPTYLCKPTFIGACMILDMHTLTHILIFSIWFFKVFLVLLFWFWFFKILMLYIWPVIICSSLQETDSLLFTFVLKKPYFPIFHKNYPINISPYLREKIS